MNIVKDYPPNYDEIAKAFDLTNRPGVVFTYGDTVYYPAGDDLPQHLKVHEGTHIQQQKNMGAKEWWDKYLVDPAFRLEQELQAYRAQYGVIKRIRNWREQEYLLSACADDLSSEMYGNMLSKAEARALITKPKGKK